MFQSFFNQHSIALLSWLFHKEDPILFPLKITGTFPSPIQGKEALKFCLKYFRKVYCLKIKNSGCKIFFFMKKTLDYRHPSPDLGEGRGWGL